MKIQSLLYSSLRWLNISILALFGMLTIVASGGSSDSGGSVDPPTGTVNIISPSVASGLPGSGTLTVSVFADGGSTALMTETIDTLIASVSMDVIITAGTHSFIILFEYTDAVFGGPYQVGISNSKAVDVQFYLRGFQLPGPRQRRIYQSGGASDKLSHRSK